ncbi:MAG: MFS transporter [Actinomycetota bacterium]
MQSAGAVRRAVIAAFVTYVVFGLPDGVFGTVWPNFRDDFGRSDSSLGWLSLAIAAGYTSGSLSASPAAERFGLPRALPASMVLATFGLATIAGAPTFWVAVAAYVALGYGWGLTDAGINAWVALTQGPRAMGMLHASYGAGAFGGPLLATAFVADGAAWRGAYVVCAVLTGATIIGLIATRNGFAIAATRPEIAGRSEPDHATRALLLLVLWFAVYVGVEVGVGAWAFTLLTEGRGESDRAAGILTASYWGGLMVGRFGLAALGHRIHPERTIRVATGGAIVSTVVLWADPGGSGGLALPVMGLMYSVMFPLAIGQTATYVGEARATRAVGYQIGGTTVGFVALTALIGVLADAHGVGVTVPVILITTGVLAAIWFALERTVRPTAGERASST